MITENSNLICAELPIDAIVEGERMRLDLGDISELADSIKLHGLIQPIVIDTNRNLIAGGRRLAAHRKLGWKTIKVTLNTQADTEVKLRMMELEENVRRKEMTWQEKCQSISKVHFLHKTLAIKEDSQWTQKQTGELCGVSIGNVNYCIEVNKFLKDPNHPIQTAESLSDALRILVQIREDACLKQMAAQFQTCGKPCPPPTLITSSTPVTSTSSLSLDALLAEPVPSAPSGGKPVFDFKATNYFRNLDCLTHMSEMDPGTINAIITDPPYGIDMAMLDQTSMQNIDRVAATHDVEQNKSLFALMLPAMYRVLAEDSFLVLWCDQDNWQLLKDLAISVGFKVQRWPLVWVKTHTCKNEAAAYNFTKATEIAMVCRKGKAVLCSPQGVNFWMGSMDETRKELAHPFVKPQLLWQWIAKAVVPPGAVVYDPFMGVGSCPLALLRLGYKVLGSELDEKHYNSMLNEVKQLVYALHGQTHTITIS